MSLDSWLDLKLDLAGILQVLDDLGVAKGDGRSVHAPTAWQTVYMMIHMPIIFTYHWEDLSSKPIYNLESGSIMCCDSN